MRKIALLSVIVALTAHAGVDIAGTDYQIIQPDASSGLSAVYVVRDASMARIVYTGASGAVEWSEFSSLGGGYAREITPVNSGGEYSINAPSEGMGYIIDDGGTRTCIWVINYEAYPYKITGATADESDCSSVRLALQGDAPEMPYYSVNGRHLSVDRQINVSFLNLSFNDETFSYDQIVDTKAFEYATGGLYLPASLCDTDFTIHPDRFASVWDSAREVVSPTVKAYAVECQTSATQTAREADNEQKAETEALGGSAPCEITFKAAVTDAAIFRRWEVATTPDFLDSFLSFNDLEFTYTFEDAGSFYVRFTADNAAGACEQQSEVYTITIGESRLECPNIFTPGASEGVNDEWKVSYKSIVEFDCHIFNRWGKTLAHLTDPSQGWDGKVGGKTVGSGVYFYVITARGSDGTVYKLSGDINVINSRRDTSPTVTE